MDIHFNLNCQLLRQEAREDRLGDFGIAKRTHPSKTNGGMRNSPGQRKSFSSPEFLALDGLPDLVGSTGMVAARADNAAMESLSALVQKNMLDRQRQSMHEQLRPTTASWIEKSYHRRRRQCRLGRLTTVETEPVDHSLKAD